MGVLHRGEAVPETMETLVPYLVRKGIALLDLHGPEGWRDSVDLTALNMGSPSACILGQVYQREHADAYAAYLVARRPWREWNGEGVRPDKPAEVDSTPYYYGAERLWERSGHADEGVLTPHELMRACAFLDCYASDATETLLEGYISRFTLDRVWTAELSR
jgi:hypothetical protein